MIKSIVLKNYCSHANTVIDFTEDNITITGTNNIGKTTLLAGIRALLFCADLPEQDVRRGTTECTLFAEFEDGRTITRTRKGTKQEYILKYANGKCKTLSNMVQIKNEIQEFTGFKPVKLNKNDDPVDLQIVNVDEHTFLLDKGPEVVLRCLSGMIAGKGVETAKININKRLSEAKSTLSVRQKDLTEELVRSNTLNSKEIKKLCANYEAFGIQLDSFLRKEEQYNQLLDFKKQLSKQTFTPQEVKQLEIDLQDCKHLSGRLKELAELQKKTVELQKINEQLTQIRSAIFNRELSILNLEKEVKATNLSCENCKTCGKTTLCQST